MVSAWLLPWSLCSSRGGIIKKKKKTNNFSKKSYETKGGRMKEKKDERMLNHFVWLYDGRKRN